MINNVKIPDVTVFIRSKLSLDELAAVISAKFLFGLKFGGKEKFLRHEDPAVFVGPLLGMEIVLWHDPETNPQLFHLDIDSYSSRDFNVWQFIDMKSSKSVNLSCFVTGMLILEGFECYCYDDDGVNIVAHS